MTTPAAAHKAMLQKALSYPGTWEDHPWGETVVKVGKKVFVFLGKGEGFSLSLKLDRTGEAALATFPFCEPTGYGLGKSGWISASFGAPDDVPLPLLLEWLDEGYRAVAPATLVKQLEGAPAGKGAPGKKTSRAPKRPPRAAKKPSRAPKKPVRAAKKASPKRRA